MINNQLIFLNVTSYSHDLISIHLFWFLFLFFLYNKIIKEFPQYNINGIDIENFRTIDKMDA